MGVRCALMTDEMIGAAEAAEILGCSIWTVHRRCRSGDLDGTQIGTRWIIRRADVAALANEERAA